MYRKLLITLLTVFLFSGCNSTIKEKEDPVIFITVNVNRDVNVNGDNIHFDELHEILLEEFQKIEASGHKQEDITVSLKINKNVKMGTVTAIQETLKNLSVKKVVIEL